jgi:serine/threonine protein kinase
MYTKRNNKQFPKEEREMRNLVWIVIVMAAFCLANRDEDGMFQECSSSGGGGVEESLGSRRRIEWVPIRPLRKGSHGELFEVVALENGMNRRTLAMKTFCLQKISRKSNLRGLKEIRVNRELSYQRSPFVLQMNDWYILNGRAFLFFELWSGGDLHDYWLNLEASPSRYGANRIEIKQIIAQIVLGVQHLHRQGVLHLDLKLENILINDSYSCIAVSDMGTSSENIHSAFDGSIGFAGSVIIPEMEEGSPYGFAADWFGVGEITAQLLRIESEIERDFISRLLYRDPKQRLGSNGDGEEVQSHPFFENINWNNLVNRCTHNGNVV